MGSIWWYLSVLHLRIIVAQSCLFIHFYRKSTEVNWSGLDQLLTWLPYWWEVGKVFNFSGGCTALFYKHSLDCRSPCIGKAQWTGAVWCFVDSLLSMNDPCARVLGYNGYAGVASDVICCDLRIDERSLQILITTILMIETLQTCSLIPTSTFVPFFVESSTLSLTCVVWPLLLYQRIQIESSHLHCRTSML